MQAIRTFLLGGWDPARVYPDLTLTFVRVFTGLSLAFAHGADKMTDPEGIIQVSASLGFPLPTVAGWAAALTEFVGGLLLAAGLLTRPVAFLILCNMTVAVYAHAFAWGDPFKADPSQGQGGYELAAFYWVIAVQFLVIGSGRFGIDRMIRR